MEAKILEGLNIVLVEEEALIAMDIEQLCYEHGAATVLAVASPSELTPGLLDAGLVNAAILDVKVAEGWTDAFARELRQRNIPFVFATGYTNAEPFFAEFPDIAVVAKPYAGNELVKALAAAVGRSSGDG